MIPLNAALQHTKRYPNLKPKTPMKRTSTLLSALALLCASALPWLNAEYPSSYQIAQGMSGIYQLGEGLSGLHQQGQLVGQVWTPPRAPNACRYMEYWWLGPDYVYPGAQNGGGFTLNAYLGPDTLLYNNVHQFRSAMQSQFGGGHMVHVASTEMRPDCPQGPQPPAAAPDVDHAVYPNPFNPTSTIQFTLPQSSHARLDVYDLSGRRIATLYDGYAEAGQAVQARFDANGLASGMYLYRIGFAGQEITGTMNLLK